MQERDAIALELRALIAEIIEVDPSRIGNDTHFVNDLEMDSLMALELLAALEKKYAIRIEEESLPELATLEGALGIVLSRMGAAATT